MEKMPTSFEEPKEEPVDISELGGKEIKHPGTGKELAESIAKKREEMEMHDWAQRKRSVEADISSPEQQEKEEKEWQDLKKQADMRAEATGKLEKEVKEKGIKIKSDEELKESLQSIRKRAADKAAGTRYYKEPEIELTEEYKKPDIEGDDAVIPIYKEENGHEQNDDQKRSA